MIRNILANLSFDTNASVRVQGMYFIHALCKHSAKNSQYCAVSSCVLWHVYGGGTGPSVEGRWREGGWAEYSNDEWQERRPIRGGTKAFNAVRGRSSQTEPPVAGSSDYTPKPTETVTQHRYSARHTGLRPGARPEPCSWATCLSRFCWAQPLKVSGVQLSSLLNSF